MSVLGASIKCTSIGFAAGFLVQSGPNLGSDIGQLAGLLAFTGVAFLLFALLSSSRVWSRAVGMAGSIESLPARR